MTQTLKGGRERRHTVLFEHENRASIAPRLDTADPDYRFDRQIPTPFAESRVTLVRTDYPPDEGRVGPGDKTIPARPATMLLSLDAAFALFDGSHHASFYHSTYGVVEEEDILNALNTANRILEAATAFHTAVHDAARLYEIEMEQIKAKEAEEAK